MEKIQAHWFAVLSNGEEVEENTGVFVEVSGELSPWLKLLQYCHEKGISIITVGIIVQSAGIEQIYHLSANYPHQQWQYSFTDKNNQSLLLLPKGFNYFRRVIKDSRPEIAEQHYIEINAVYDQFTLVTIVDENTGNESWSMVIRNEEEK